MRPTVLLVLLSLLSPACAPAPESPPPAVPRGASAADAERDRRQVGEVLDAWHAAAARADEAAYFGLMADDVVFLGTDATERWGKAAFRDYAHPHFAKGKAWRFRAVRRAVLLSADGELAWFDEDLATEKLGPVRGSGVLRREQGGYRIVQYNLAVTVPNERFDPVREAAGGATLLAPEVGGLGVLAWMAGAWVAKDADGVTEELWGAPEGGLLLATSRTVREGQLRSFELARIERRGDGAVYVAQPGGGPATEFTLEGSLAAATSQASFVAPGHDYPKRITYRRDGDVLVARIEGGPGAPVREWRFERALVDRR